MANAKLCKRPEITVATWEHKRGAEFFGDIRTTCLAACDSMWLSLRVFDDGSYEAFKARQAIANIGLWVWWATDSDTISVEFRAHGVHSATEGELCNILAELKRLNKRLPKRLHGQCYAAYVMACIKAAGVKRCTEYRGLSVAEQYHPIASIGQRLADEIGARCNVAQAA